MHGGLEKGDPGVARTGGRHKFPPASHSVQGGAADCQDSEYFIQAVVLVRFVHVDLRFANRSHAKQTLATAMPNSRNRRVTTFDVWRLFSRFFRGIFDAVHFECIILACLPTQAEAKGHARPRGETWCSVAARPMLRTLPTHATKYPKTNETKKA